jgi:hypothetical protein
MAELNVHHGQHQSPTVDTILGQFHAIPMLKTYFPKTHLNKISPQIESQWVARFSVLVQTGTKAPPSPLYDR